MSNLFRHGWRAEFEQIRQFVTALPGWTRRLGYYGLALLFVAAAALLRWGLEDVLSSTPTLVFYLAWVGAAAFGGLGPGLLATAASLLCIDLLFDPTVGQVSFVDPTSIARLLILLTGGLIVSVVGEKMRRTRIRERRQMRELADLTQLTGLGQLLIRDDQDRILLWSDGCARLYGFTAEQAVGRVSHELLRTEFPQPLETIRAALQKTGRWEGEQTHRRADGSAVHVASLWVLRNGTAHPVVLEVNNDITDRKRAEAALREARNGLDIRVQERTAQLRAAKELVESERQRFQNVLDQLPAYLVLLTPDFHVSFANRFFEERFGKCEGRRCFEYLFHRTGPCEICNAYEVFKTNAPQHWEWIGPDGRNYDIYDFPFTDVDGAPLVMEVGLDITERKRAEAELVKHREHLEELVQERTRQLETANEELRANEQALHDAEDRLHLAMESGKVGIWEWGVGTEDVEWSPGVYALLGYRAGEVTPTREALRRRIHPQDRERQDQALHDSLEQCQDYLCEFRVIWLDGSVHWIEARGQYVYVDNGNGVVLRMRGVLSDIDQRKKVEEALRESEDRFRKLFKANLAGVYITKLDGTILDFNDAMMRMLGYDSREELFQHRSPEFFADPEFRKVLLNLLQRDGFVPAREAVLRRKDGSVFYAIGSGVLLANEQTGEPYIQGAAIDITERKQAEEALRRSEEQFHRLFEDDLTGNFISTPEGRILLCNPAFAEIFGFSGALDAVGTSILDLYADPGEREPLLARLRQKGKIERLEAWRKRRNGEPIHIVENLVGHFNDQGELYEIKGYVFEDTERKRAEETLRELTATLENEVARRTAELRHRARQLQKLTLDMSETEDRERKRMAEILHDDLQQQLAAAKFHLGLLRSRARYDASLQATAAQIEHMLIEAIQKSRSLSHELSPAVMHHTDFADTLRWLAHQVRAKHGLVVHVQAHGEVRSQSDAIKGFLYKAVQELLFNIVKHARVHEATIRVRQYRQQICLTVSDRGRGFDPQELRETAGFGLLNIRERIELLGGRMKIKSVKDRGSTFFIVAPAGEPVEAGSEVETSPGGRAEIPHAPQEDNGRLRVLLADDHEIVREGIRSLLSDEHDVEIVGEATNGREAVDLAYRLYPDVVIMDVSMPLIDGDAATRQIKAIQPQTRVIALSMYEEPEKKEMMYRAGAESYVLKTAPAEELLAAIRGQTAAA